MQGKDVHIIDLVPAIQVFFFTLDGIQDVRYGIFGTRKHLYLLPFLVKTEYVCGIGS